MVSTSLAFNEQQLRQYLAQALGQTLSQPEFSSCTNKIQILEPAAGKKFWQTADASMGIWIILGGKVRLLDSSDNLIATLEAGASFGELTLFPEEHFRPYAARASVKLKLGYLSGEVLQTLLLQYPAMRSHLHHQAVLQDLLLFCRQNPTLNDASLESLMKVILLLEEQELKVGKVPKSFLNNQQLWLVRRGEMVHSFQKKLTDGSLYISSQEQDFSWQVTQPTELYTLDRSHWETALSQLPQLAQILESELNQTVNKSAPESFPKQPDIPIPSSTQQSQQSRQQISRAYFPK